MASSSTKSKWGITNTVVEDGWGMPPKQKEVEYWYCGEGSSVDLLLKPTTTILQSPIRKEGEGELFTYLPGEAKKYDTRAAAEQKAAELVLHYGYLPGTMKVKKIPTPKKQVK
jgi:hypothetical protein